MYFKLLNNIKNDFFLSQVLNITKFRVVVTSTDLLANDVSLWEVCRLNEFIIKVRTHPRKLSWFAHPTVISRVRLTRNLVIAFLQAFFPTANYVVLGVSLSKHIIVIPKEIEVFVSLIEFKIGCDAPWLRYKKWGKISCSLLLIVKLLDCIALCLYKFLSALLKLKASSSFDCFQNWSWSSWAEVVRDVV